MLPLGSTITDLTLLRDPKGLLQDVMRPTSLINKPSRYYRGLIYSGWDVLCRGREKLTVTGRGDAPHNWAIGNMGGPNGS